MKGCETYLKILILFFSGVGNTKMVANKIRSLLLLENNITISSIESIRSDLDLTCYDAVVIGFPTIHSAPAKPIIEFVRKLSVLKTPCPAFIFTTCGLYSTNTLRIFAKEAISKNIIPIQCKSYRCAATDGSLIASFMKIWFKHDKNLVYKIENDTKDFLERLKSNATADIPSVKWYSILNYPNKFFGQRHKFTIYLHNNKCIKCGECRVNCPTKAIQLNNNGYPTFEMTACINCYRCIHHCPNKALSLFRSKTPVKTLDNFEMT